MSHAIEACRMRLKHVHFDVEACCSLIEACRMRLKHVAQRLKLVQSREETKGGLLNLLNHYGDRKQKKFPRTKNGWRTDEYRGVQPYLIEYCTGTRTVRVPAPTYSSLQYQ